MDAVLAPGELSETECTRWNPRWFVPLAFTLGGLAMLPMDVAIASFFKGRQLAAPLRESIEVWEAFGHGMGAILIVIAVAVLTPANRRYLPWVIAGSLGSGLVANSLKLAIHRIRPAHFDLMTGTVLNTFDKGFSGGAAMQSFPSAHTATAAGMAVMLTALFPHGRWYFFTLAVLVGIQRVVSSAHFPSDVCAGATVGWFVGMVCVASMRFFCDIEARRADVTGNGGIASAHSRNEVSGH